MIWHDIHGTGGAGVPMTEIAPPTAGPRVIKRLYNTAFKMPTRPARATVLPRK